MSSIARLDTHLFELVPTNITQGEIANNYLITCIWQRLLDSIISTVCFVLFYKDPHAMNQQESTEGIVNFTMSLLPRSYVCSSGGGPTQSGRHAQLGCFSWSYTYIQVACGKV